MSRIRVVQRGVVLLAGLGLVVGLVGGFALGRATKAEPRLADQVADVIEDYQPVRRALDALKSEYPKAVRGGRVVDEARYAAAKAQIERAQDVYRVVRDDLRVLLSPGRVSAAGRELHELDELVKRAASPEQVLNQIAKFGETLAPPSLLGTAR